MGPSPNLVVHQTSAHGKYVLQPAITSQRKHPHYIIIISLPLIQEFTIIIIITIFVLPW